MPHIENGVIIDREQYIQSLIERCLEKQTSPHNLAQLRHDVTVALLESPQTDTYAAVLEDIAEEKVIIGPDELSTLRRIGSPLPAPHQPGQRVDKYIPAYHDLLREIRTVAERGGKIGVAFWTGDLINSGHIGVAAMAKELKDAGEFDFFLVMMTTDLETSLEKGIPGEKVRPMMRAKDRIAMASQIDGVDAVYTISVMSTPSHIVFEMFEKARICEEFGVSTQPSFGVKNISPEDIKLLYHAEEWPLYAQHYLGVPVDFDPVRYASQMLVDFDLPARDIDSSSFWSLSRVEFEESYGTRLEFPWPSDDYLEESILEEWHNAEDSIWNLFPLHLRFPYYFLTRDLSRKPGIESFRLIVSDHDKNMARMHQLQTGFPAIVIPAQSPETSSTLLIESHVDDDHEGLRSEAYVLCQNTLGVLETWDDRYDFPELRFFADWTDPFDTSHLCPSDERLRDLAHEE